MGKAGPVISDVRHEAIDHLIRHAAARHDIGAAGACFCPSEHTTHNACRQCFISIDIMGDGIQLCHQCRTSLRSPLVAADAVIGVDIKQLQTCTVTHEIGGVEGIVQCFLRQAARQRIAVCFALCVQQSRGVRSDPGVDLLVGDVRLDVILVRQRSVIRMLCVELIDLREGVFRRILELKC